MLTIASDIDMQARPDRAPATPIRCRILPALHKEPTCPPALMTSRR